MSILLSKNILINLNSLLFIQNSSPGSRQQQPRHKRISAVTMAKIQQKQQIQALLTSAGSTQWKKLRHPVQAKLPSRTSYRGTTRRSLNFERPSTASSMR